MPWTKAICAAIARSSLRATIWNSTAPASDCSPEPKRAAQILHGRRTTGSPCSIAKQTQDLAASANCEALQDIPPGMHPNRRGAQAAAAQKRIEIVHVAAPLDVRGSKGNAEGNRDFRSIFDVMRGGCRKMQAEARVQVKQPAPRFEIVTIDQIAMGAAVVALELFFGNDSRIAAVEQVNLLAAANLQQEIVLRVHVIRRHGSRRGDKDEPLAETHPRSDRLGMGG